MLHNRESSSAAVFGAVILLAILTRGECTVYNKLRSCLYRRLYSWFCIPENNTDRTRSKIIEVTDAEQ